MKVFVDFQEKLSQTAIFSIRESDFAKHYNGKNGKLLVNLMNYPDKIVISSIFDVFPDENPRKNTIFLPKNIQKYLESQRKSLGNLYANIFSLDPVKIPEFPFEISLKIKQIFHKNTQIREKSLYLAFLTLPELVFLLNKTLKIRNFLVGFREIIHEKPYKTRKSLPFFKRNIPNFNIRLANFCENQKNMEFFSFN